MKVFHDSPGKAWRDFLAVKGRGKYFKDTEYSNRKNPHKSIGFPYFDRAERLASGFTKFSAPVFGGRVTTGTFCVNENRNGEQEL